MTPEQVLAFAKEKGAKVVDIRFHGFPRHLAAFHRAHERTG
jgi:hypothetical protein